MTEERKRHDYYECSKSSTVKLIEKLLSPKEDKTERVSSRSLAIITGLLLVLCRDKSPTTEDEVIFEPAALSLNSVRGRAMHSIMHLLACMNRSKLAKSEYKPLFDELDWHLDPCNDSVAAIRAVYGWHFRFLSATDKDWSVSKLNTIFSDDKLGEAACDAYVSFNNAYIHELDSLADVFKRQLSRLTVPPVVIVEYVEKDWIAWSNVSPYIICMAIWG